MQIDVTNGEIKWSQIEEIIKFDDEGTSTYLNDPFTFNHGIVNDRTGKIIGAGIVRVVNEFKMILDPNLSNFQKSKVFKLLLEEAIKKAQCNEIIVSTTKGGWEFRRLLIDHYNFSLDNGILLRSWK